MSEKKQVLIQLNDGNVCEYIIEISLSAPWKILLSGADCKQREFVGDDLFEAFLNLRKSLEKQGYKLLCNGARKDVFPSGMSRSMGGGRKAYIIRIGLQTNMNDIVDIFDYAEPKIIATAKEQQLFYQQWVESLR